MAEWLDYGSLGLLAVILAALGIGAREAIKRWQEHWHEREVSAAQVALDAQKVEAQRRSTQDQWIRQLIDQDRVERESHVKALQELLKADVQSREALTQALNSMCERMDEHEKRATNRFEQAEERARERHRLMLSVLETATK